MLKLLLIIELNLATLINIWLASHYSNDGCIRYRMDMLEHFQLLNFSRQAKFN